MKVGDNLISALAQLANSSGEMINNTPQLKLSRNQLTDEELAQISKLKKPRALLNLIKQQLEICETVVLLFRTDSYNDTWSSQHDNNDFIASHPDYLSCRAKKPLQ